MESLTIPYKSIISFSDPSVNFGLKFNVDDSDEGIIEEQNQEQLNSENLSGKVVSLADFRKNRDNKN